MAKTVATRVAAQTMQTVVVAAKVAVCSRARSLRCECNAIFVILVVHVINPASEWVRWHCLLALDCVSVRVAVTLVVPKKNVAAKLVVVCWYVALLLAVTAAVPTKNVAAKLVVVCWYVALLAVTLVVPNKVADAMVVDCWADVVAADSFAQPNLE